MHYYQFNIGDYKSHTEHLTEMEDLAYRRMLDLYYLHEKPLPKDPNEIARLIRMRTHFDCIAIVLREFFVESNDGWFNQRAESEIHKISDKSRKASESAKARWLKTKVKVEDTNAMRTHSERNATHNTIHNTQDTIKEISKTKKIDTPEGVIESVWQDFIQHRKSKRSPVTSTAIKGIEREAKKANISLNDALQEICSRGWTGFKAEWINDKSKQSWADKQKAWVAEATGQAYEPDVFDIAIAQARRIK